MGADLCNQSAASGQQSLLAFQVATVHDKLNKAFIQYMYVPRTSYSRLHSA